MGSGRCFDAADLDGLSDTIQDAFGVPLLVTTLADQVSLKDSWTAIQ
jgi:hypothetical protein